MRRLFLLLLLVASGWFVRSRRRDWYARALDLPPVRNQVKVTRNIAIAMPDGVRLMADHYEPASAGTYPTVFIRTPYGRNWKAFPGGIFMLFAAERFAERGYHVLIQGTRGQFDSGGDFVPFVHEKEDGLATLAWLRRQPWFNGQIGMWGNSYVGLVQWALVGDAGPELQALVPVTTGADVRKLIFADDVFALELAARWAMLVAGTGEGIVKRKLSFWEQLQRFAQIDKLVTPAFQTPSLHEADRAVLGEHATFFQRWLATDGRADDPYWQATNYKARVAETEAAVHLVAGWYDIFLHDQIDDYHRLRAAGHTPYLTVGPWGHMDNATLANPLREALIWFDAQLKGDKSRLRRSPVRLYIMGAETWREMESYPPPANPATLFLHPGSQLTATPPATADGRSHFTFNPADPTPSLGGILFSPIAGRVDNAPLEARDDVIVFTGEPLTADMEIIGPVRATVYLAADTPPCDLFVRLNDVNPADVSTNVCDGLRRIDPADVSRAADGSVCVLVELSPTAYRFGRGHRLRLLLAGGAHPRYARHPGRNEPVTAADQFVRQVHTILHDANHPSAITLARV